MFQVEQYVVDSVGLHPVVFERFFRTPFDLHGPVAVTFKRVDEKNFWRYVELLEQTLRWQTGDQPVRSFEGENVYQHVAAGFHWIKCLRSLCPNLKKYINFNRVEDMFLFHDAEEIAGKDIAMTDPARLAEVAADPALAQQRRSNQQVQDFMETVLPLFPVTLQKRIAAVFLEYEHRTSLTNPKKYLAAQMTKWIDIVVGNQVALAYFHPVPNDFSKARTRDISLAKFLQQTQIIREVLKKQAQGVHPYQEDSRLLALQEFDLIVKNILLRYINAGYQDEVNYFQDQFGEIIHLTQVD